ncbi:MAG: GNA1162 family protein, partial [Betaproteobacteria bacterium]
MIKHQTSAGWRTLTALALATLLSACATPPPPYDYSAFRAAKPASILVMPPLNNTPDVKATNSVWAQAVVPLADSGYYVVPISVVAETFRENGLNNAAEANQANPAKLREFFGADTALYVNVTQYGTSYKVITSDTTVAI